MNDPETPGSVWNPLAAFGLALGVYVVAFLAARFVSEPVTARYPWARQAVTQGLMAAVALGAMAASRRPWAGLFGGTEIAAAVVIVLSVTALG